MGPRLLGCEVLFLLGAGPTEAEVTQTPSHLITGTGKEVAVTCSQNMNHEAMYWYRQNPGMGLKLICYSINVDIVNKGEAPDGYVVSRKEKKNFPLTLVLTSTNQTSLYLCASSLITVLQRQLLSAHTKKATTSAERLHPQETPPQGGGANSNRSSSPIPQLQRLSDAASLQSVMPVGQFFYLLHQ